MTYSDLTKSIGNQLRWYRIRTGNLTQSTIGEKAGINAQHVSNYERGKIKSLRKIWVYAIYIGADPVDILQRAIDDLSP